ncbi:hypothetical protein [Flavimaricola marinus]|uniref:Uncharacterized protein n=1 Tax=Flavimaricola marinus TaxID=1819565 RepID=A0A238LMP8_9RHOB|nr:hypothetical protein [Flavimaricola marinus]SMY10100.1 hypothetical protein LOM8899_04275 [Flavimaricola marinus]
MGLSPSKLFEISTRLSNILSAFEASGIRIQIGDDFATYRSLRTRQSDRGPIYAMFDVASSYIDRDNGFWICGYDATGELVHTQAVRLLDLSGGTLATHLNNHRHKYITPDSTPDPDLTFYSGPDALHSITGRVCYHGDFWLRGRGLGGPRSQGATSLLSRLLIEIMVGAWNPSFVFALVPKSLAAKGAHLRYGYNHCDPGVWLGPDQQITDEDYLIWMGANDMANLLARPTPSLHVTSNTPKFSATNGAVAEMSHLDAQANV